MSENFIKKIQNIGVIGCGQLGQMICQSAKNLGFNTVVFGDETNSPASLVADEIFVADYEDFEALKKFANKVDVVTCEFENIPFKTAEFLSQIVKIYPNPEILKIAQNRILEKSFINKIGVKTANWVEIKSLSDLQKSLANFKKAILKTATMGYDGKGQFVLNYGDDLEKVWEEVKNNSLILEEFCPFSSEISVIVARAESGELSCYEPLTNIHKNGILDESHYPAKISENIKIKVQEIAIKIAKNLELIGILAIEFFVLENGDLIVNEMAPRPHNSGHFSMDANNTSQFEQIVRVISGLKLGNIDFVKSGYMKNLIGDDVNNIEDYKNNPHAKIHLYGKKEAKKGRKMGHINFLTSKF